uniref:Uncharacterized protein n=1 Tax=Anser cygnoides TaxID=8845 RepID=A0A8B9E9A2_ANSCY
RPLVKVKQLHKMHVLTSLHLLAVLGHVIRADRPQKLDVVVAVVLRHFFCVCLVRAHTYIDLHLPVETIVQQQVVGHPDPVGLHRMPLAIIIMLKSPSRRHKREALESDPLPSLPSARNALSPPRCRGVSAGDTPPSPAAQPADLAARPRAEAGVR